MAQDQDGNAKALRAWSTNAEFWDARMADGNDFFNLLIWPAVEKLLGPVAGERLLDAACGNGVTSRRLAEAGAQVTAFDFSEAMIALARKRDDRSKIDYRVLDATNLEDILKLRAGGFHGALCNMALFDMAEIEPLLEALGSLIRPGGRFVFSVIHPCFNNPSTIQMGEQEERGGEFLTTYSVKISRYLTPYTRAGIAMPGQPVAHPYFHRPLCALLEPAFRAGFVLDALEERAFPPEYARGSTSLSWNGRLSEIPPVLVGRMRPRSA